jgi:hypothetical protein
MVQNMNLETERFEQNRKRQENILYVRRNRWLTCTAELQTGEEFGRINFQQNVATNKLINSVQNIIQQY